jgi:hypothetical protein
MAQKTTRFLSAVPMGSFGQSEKLQILFRIEECQNSETEM